MQQPPLDTLVRTLNQAARTELESLLREPRAEGQALWSAPTDCPDW